MSASQKKTSTLDKAPINIKAIREDGCSEFIEILDMVSSFSNVLFPRVISWGKGCEGWGLGGGGCGHYMCELYGKMCREGGREREKREREKEEGGGGLGGGRGGGGQGVIFDSSACPRMK
jgi:hypothetical protein